MEPIGGEAQEETSVHASPLQEATGGVELARVNMFGLGSELGWSREETQQVVEYLKGGNCSGGCWGWQPWVALEQPAQGGQRVDAVLARGRDVGAHGQERLRAVQGPPAPRHLLLQLDHADVAFGLVVRPRRRPRLMRRVARHVSG